MNRVKLVLSLLVGLCVGIPVIMIGVRDLNMHLKSSFSSGDRIPAQYTCDGTSESPPLTFTNIPSGTKSLVLILENPKSETGQGRWIHWLVFNLPPTVTSLPVDANIEKLGGIVGRNSIEKNSYAAPCPAGLNHYYFRLYALDSVLDLDKNATRDQVMKKAEGHIKAEAYLVGIYERPKHPELPGEPGVYT